MHILKKISQVFLFQILLFSIFTKTGIAAGNEVDSVPHLLKRAAEYRQKGDIESLISTIRKTHSIRKRNFPANSLVVIKSYINMSTAHSYAWDYDSSLYYLKIAENLYQQCTECRISLIGNIYSQVGLMYKNKGDYMLAKSYYARALEYLLADGVADINELALVYLRYADAERISGNIELSDHYYEQSYRYIRLISANTGYLLYYYNGLSFNSEKKGDLANSIRNKKEALKITLKDSASYTKDLATLYNNLGMDYYNDNQDALALTYFQRAENIFVSLRSRSASYAGLKESLGSLYMKHKEFTKALQYYQEGIQMLSPGYVPKNNLENPTAAVIEDKITALPILRSKTQCLRLIYEQNKQLSYIDAAINASLLIIDLIDNLRSSSQTYESKIQISSYEYDIYNLTLDLISLAYRANPKPAYIEKAFRVSEKSKSSILMASVRELDARQFGGIPDSLLQKEQNLSSRISFYKSAIYEERQNDDPDTLKISSWTRYLFAAQHEHDLLVQLFENDFPEYYNLKFDQSVPDSRQLQKQLPRNAVIIQYSLTDSALYTFLIQKEKIIFNTQHLDTTFHKQVSEFLKLFHHFDFSRQSHSDFSTFCRLSKSMHDYLIKPVEDNLDAEKIIFIPDGILSYIPFETLISDIPDDPDVKNYKDLDYLLRSYEVSYAYSSGLFLQTVHQKNKFGSHKLLAFAPSYEPGGDIEISSKELRTRQKYRKNLFPIPGAMEEVNAIKQLMPADIYTGEDATELVFRNIVSGYDILHLAMHTIIDNQNPLYSKLIFTHTEDSIYDGMLNTYEVFGLKLDSRMVVLSACSTGEGEFSKGEGVLSLARGFVYAGAPSLVMSMWEVEDKSGVSLMKDFYKQIRQGRSKPAALRRAKLNYLEEARPENTHPFFWSTYVILGNPAPLFRNRILFILFYAAIIAGIFLLFIYLRKRRRIIP
jgi:CHAT domain-containing protein